METIKLDKLTVLTEDNIHIAINHYNGINSDEVVIIAPGWCMTKDSKSFVGIANIFTKEFDVISLDFRGHGKSGGFYTFSAKEVMDLRAVVEFAKGKLYKKIYLAGFSLGAAVALINASEDSAISKVIAVSAPCEFGKIEIAIWKKEAWLETLKKFELDRFLSLRFNLIPLKKIKPVDIVKNIKVPTLFVAGEKDPTVYSWHTKLLYDKAVCVKDFKLYKNGYHAEDLYLYHKEDFSDLCLNWLKMQVKQDV